MTNQQKTDDEARIEVDALDVEIKILEEQEPDSPELDLRRGQRNDAFNRMSPGAQMAHNLFK